MLMNVAQRINGGVSVCLMQILVFDYALFSGRTITFPHILSPITIRVVGGVSRSALDYIETCGAWHGRSLRHIMTIDLFGRRISFGGVLLDLLAPAY